MPVIRVAEPRDLAALEEIENLADAPLAQHLKAADWAQAPSGETRAAMPGFVLVAAESIGGTAVGFVHVLEADGTAHLEQLSVRPESARRGLGRALVRAAMAEALARGHRYMTLRTYADVAWNAPFYATCGFVVREPQTKFQRELVEIEEGSRLARYGTRVQMTVKLSG
jgi:GNAT superfamily N-acetyltransferase